MLANWKDLMFFPGVAGREQTFALWLAAECSRFGQASRDALGNVILHRPGTGKKIMLTTSMDTAGLLVTYVKPEERIRVQILGQLPAWMYVGRLVLLPGGQALVRSDRLGQDVKAEELYLEPLGCRITVGDTAFLLPHPVQSEDGLYSAHLSERLGCACLLQLLETEPAGCDLYCVFTVQGQLGNRGASAAAFSVSPDLIISVEPCRCYRDYRPGDGPAVMVMDNDTLYSPEAIRLLERAAEKAGVAISRQTDGAQGAGGTLQKGSGGVPVGCLAYCVADMQSAVEHANLRDVEQCTAVLRALVEGTK